MGAFFYSACRDSPPIRYAVHSFESPQDFHFYENQSFISSLTSFSWFRALALQDDRPFCCKQIRLTKCQSEGREPIHQNRACSHQNHCLEFINLSKMPLQSHNKKAPYGSFFLFGVSGFAAHPLCGSLL